MSNDIVSSKGNIVGQWDGNDANDLIKELVIFSCQLQISI